MDELSRVLSIDLISEIICDLLATPSRSLLFLARKKRGENPLPLDVEDEEGGEGLEEEKEDLEGREAEEELVGGIKDR